MALNKNTYGYKIMEELADKGSLTPKELAQFLRVLMPTQSKKTVQGTVGRMKVSKYITTQVLLTQEGLRQMTLAGWKPKVEETEHQVLIDGVIYVPWKPVNTNEKE